MPVFKPPYGTKDQHVPSPAHHFGYHYIVAYLVDGGSRADYIKRACSDAHAEGLPRDAVCHGPLGASDGNWQRRGDMQNRTYGRRLDAYAAALTKYEQELKAEREQRST